ncbi:MAG: membrane protein insertion efficiency factor YidD [Acidobacteriaceae bacterium]
MTRTLRFYKSFIAPFVSAMLRARGLEAQCKFHPTCSEYTAAALELHGPLRGSALALWRLLRCNPFGSGGLDLVPSPTSHAHDLETAQ